MARFIAPLVSNYTLSPQPLVAVNKAGGTGAGGKLTSGLHSFCWW